MQCLESSGRVGSQNCRILRRLALILAHLGEDNARATCVWKVSLDGEAQCLVTAPWGLPTETHSI